MIAFCPVVLLFQFMIIISSFECHHPYGLSTTPQRAFRCQLKRFSPVRFPFSFGQDLVKMLVLMILSDDEYRLLRQNLFEQHSGYASVPVESPLVPITAIHIQRACKY